MTSHELPLVRAAVPEDFEQIMKLCAQLHEENGAADVDWPKVTETIIHGINRNHAMIGIIGPVGGIEGVIYLNFSTLWYTGEILLQELFAYVCPEKRKSQNARALLTFARNTAKRLQCKLLIGVISNTRTAAKIKLYERVLGQPSGGYFFLEGK